MFRRVLSWCLMVIFVLFSNGIMAGGIKTKNIDQTTGQVLDPSPSFKNIYRRGETLPPDKRDVEPGAASASSAVSSGMSITSGGGEGGIAAGSMQVLYQVHVLGEAKAPGTYRISPSERVSEVLARAGGITESGSERMIELRRSDGKIKHVDLFAFKIFGRLDENPYLMDNDVIFVPLLKSLVQVVGAVKRPDYYELKQEKNLKEVIDIAGGLGNSYSPDQPIRVIRFEAGQKKIEEVPIYEADLISFSVRNGDVIYVPDVVTANNTFDFNVISPPGSQPFYPAYEDRVYILGGISRPGAYPFNPFNTIGQYISLAGGLTEYGRNKYTVISTDGKVRRAKDNDSVNPGETISIARRALRPIDWVGFSMSLASFGLSTTSTVLALTMR